MKVAVQDSPRVLAIFAGLVAVAVYVNALANGFALDDVFIIELNSRAHDPTDLRSIWLTPYWPFRGQELGLYRPATIFLYALQWAMSDGGPWLFHAVSIALHALATVLVFALLSRLTSRVPALVGALIFAVHPVHVEAVANIVGQAEIVAAILVLTACLIHSGRPDGATVSWPRRTVIVALFLLALAIKESAVVLPALLIILDLAQRRVKLSIRGVAEYADAMLMPLFLLTAALAWYLVIRFEVMGGSITGVDAAPSMPYLREEFRVLNALRAFPEFLRLMFFPQELAADYHPAVLLPVETVRPMVILGAGLLALLTVCALTTPWLPHLGFPAAWFLISILTVSNLFFPIGVLVAERTLYLPSVALCAMVAFAWRFGASRASPATRRLTPILLLGVITLLGVRTWTRNPDWQSTRTVLQAHVRDYPHSYRSQWALATTHQTRGNLDRAEQHYRLGDQIYPRDAQFLTEFGDFMLLRGRLAEGIALLERAHALHPNMSRTVMLLAESYLAARKYHAALSMAIDAEALGVDIATTAPLRGSAYTGLGDTTRAVAAWRVAVRHAETPGWQLWMFLGRALAFHGLEREARAALGEARSLSSDPASLEMIARTIRALDEGCYDLRPGNDTLPPQNMPAADRSCDPLGQWVWAVARPSMLTEPIGAPRS